MYILKRVSNELRKEVTPNTVYLRALEFREKSKKKVLHAQKQMQQMHFVFKKKTKAEVIF